MPSADYRGRYINLDRSAERRAQLEANLAEIGVAARYQRFAAVDGAAPGVRRGTLTPGEAGCFASHTQLLAEHAGDAAPLHVLEDDAVVSSQFEPAVRSLIAGGALERYDLVFTETFVQVDLAVVRDYKRFFDANVERDARRTVRRFALLDLRGKALACTSSYFVGPASIRRVHDVLRGGLHGDPTLPLDLFMRAKVDAGELRAAVMFPFVTSIRLDQTIRRTIERAGADDLSRAAADLLRYAFYVGRDPRASEALTAALAAAVEGDEQLRLIASALAFAASPAYKVF